MKNNIQNASRKNGGFLFLFFESYCLKFLVAVLRIRIRIILNFRIRIRPNQKQAKIHKKVTFNMLFLIIILP